MIRIKELRKINGFSQQKLAERLGITQATLSGWENEKYEIDNESLIKCSQIFNVSVDYILGHETSKDSEINYLDFYTCIFGVNGLKIIKKQLAPLISAYGIDNLAADLGVSFTDIKQFLLIDDSYGFKVWEKFENLLAILETNATNLILSSAQFYEDSSIGIAADTGKTIKAEPIDFDTMIDLATREN